MNDNKGESIKPLATSWSLRVDKCLVIATRQSGCVINSKDYENKCAMYQRVPGESHQWNT